MKNVLNSFTSTVSKAVLFCVGCIIAGLGLAFVMVLAVFALAAAGLAIVATPFVGWVLPSEETADTVRDQQTAV